MSKLNDIFDIEGQLRILIEEFEKLDEADQAPYCDAIKGYVGTEREKIAAKLDELWDYIVVLEGRAEIRKAEAKRMTTIAGYDLNRAERIRLGILRYMDAAGLEKVHTPKRTLTPTNNGGAEPMEVDKNVEPTTVPPRFRQKVVGINKDAVRDYLKSGKSLPWARLLPRGRTVRVR